MEMKLDLDFLLKLRKNKAWTQAHLAEVCGLSLRTIQRIEKSGSASHDSIQALASVFNVSTEALIFKEDDHIQKQTVVVKQHFIDTFITRLGLVLMIIVPIISIFTSVTGTNLKMSIPDDFTHDPSFFHTRSHEYTSPPNAIKGTRTVSSSSSASLLFGYSNITYFTYLPAVILFCISIVVFVNRKKWVRNCLILSSVIFIFTSSKLSLIVFLPCMALFYLLNKYAQKNNWNLLETT